VPPPRSPRCAVAPLSLTHAEWCDTSGWRVSTAVSRSHGLSVSWLAPQGKQPQAKGKGKGKGKGGGGGARGGSSSKAAAGPSGASGGGQPSSSQGSGRRSASPAHVIGLSTAVQAALPTASEASSSSQHTEPPPASGSSTKADKEKARKERQRQRYMEAARHVLYEAVHRVEDTASLDAECVQAAEEAMHEAAKYASRCEALAALVEFARTLIEQARTAAAERARVAAEAAEAEAEAAAMDQEAEAAAERLQLEVEAAALASRMQEVHARLGVVPPLSPAPQPEEAVCVVCMDAPKTCAVLPCMHMCMCVACTQQLLEQGAQSCPVCRAPMERIERVFT
jgi:hypothetical protein